MSLRDVLPEVLDTVQAISGPDHLDIEPNKVFVVKRTWSGDEPGLGTEAEQLTEILPRPRVVERASGRELTVSPVRISHTKADGTTAGYTAAQLNPPEGSSGETLYRVTGPNAGDYALIGFDAHKPFRYTLTLRRLDRRHPLPTG